MTLKLYLVLYNNEHGHDIFPVLIQSNMRPPNITNAFLKKFGVDYPELEREDESAEWQGPYDLDSLPVIRAGVLDWIPPEP